MIKRCEICGREFAAKRSDALYCSATCRSRKMRGVPFTGELQPPDTSIAITDDEVAMVIQQAHCTAADLSRASLYTPAPLCLSLKNVAKKLEGALRSEGL